VYGDVVFDEELGGTILSTEDLFTHLARQLLPERLLFAGLEPGVWEQYPARNRLLPVITPGSLANVEAGLKGSASTDVTGGMLDKVHKTLALVQEIPGLQGMIFSGEIPGNLARVLGSETLGTLMRA
jgi:isopentenyl phosphate kinase